MKFGTIDNIMLLGGGGKLYQFALNLKHKNIDLVVVSGKRHFSEKIIDNTTLQSLLLEQNIPFIETTEPMDESVTSLISKTTLGISMGAPWIFRKGFIDLFNGRLVNVHGTRLPKNRGGGWI